MRVGGGGGGGGGGALIVKLTMLLKDEPTRLVA
jgi:hypothetical protein